MALELGPVIGSIGGGSVEETPVSMSGSGGSPSNPTVYPLATVDAGDRAMIVVTGTMDPSSTGANGRPHLQIGTRTFETPHSELDGSNNLLGVFASGVVQVAVLSRDLFRTTSFTGTVYVTRM